MPDVVKSFVVTGNRYYAIYSPSKGWFRGTWLWRWTRFKRLAALNKDRYLLSALLKGELRFDSGYKLPDGATIREVIV